MPMWLTYFLSHNLIGLNPSCITYYTAWVSSNSMSTSLFIRSIILPSLSPSLSLKTSCIFKLLIRGVIFPDLFWWFSFLIMPPIRFSVSDHYNWLVTTILSLSEVMLFCSYCVEKALVCITIISPIGHQPSSCIECM